jgi:hypothetical protein
MLKTGRIHRNALVYVADLFRDIKTELRAINIKLDLLTALHTGAVTVITNDTLLNLPQHLQKTLRAILQLNTPCTASDIHTITGRARAIESKNANELVCMGILIKHREHQRMIFTTSSGIDKVKS